MPLVIEILHQSAVLLGPLTEFQLKMNLPQQKNIFLPI